MSSPQTAPPSAAGASAAAPDRWHTRSWEARLLAGSLRSAPVTLRHGATAEERSSLLHRGVMPMLGRRSLDRALIARGADVRPFPQPRGGGPGRTASDGTELVLVIDAWHPAPLPALSDLFDAARDDD